MRPVAAGHPRRGCSNGGYEEEEGGDDEEGTDDAWEHQGRGGERAPDGVRRRDAFLRRRSASRPTRGAGEEGDGIAGDAGATGAVSQ